MVTPASTGPSPQPPAPRTRVSKAGSTSAFRSRSSSPSSSPATTRRRISTSGTTSARLRSGGAGAAARHRHLPHHVLQGGRGDVVRLRRIHHARGAVGLADPLPALDRRLVLLHRRVSAHVSRAAVRLVQGAARAAVAVRHGACIWRSWPKRSWVTCCPGATCPSGARR